MITRNLLWEIETGLLQAHTRASRSIGTATSEVNFLLSAQQKDQFLKIFSDCLKERKPLLEQQIKLAGYPSSTKLTEEVQKLMESRVRNSMISSASLFHRKNFEKFVHQFKIDVQNTFYGNYLKK